MKEYLSLFQSQTSASYQTLRMWVASPHRRTPRLGPLVSSSEDSLHQPERASSSSVRPEGLRTPVGGPVGSSVLRVKSHHSVLTSGGIVPGPSGTVIRRSHRTVGSYRSATTDPFPPLPSDLPMPQLIKWLLSSDSPVSPASLRQGLHNFSSFEGSSNLWIFRARWNTYEM